MNIDNMYLIHIKQIFLSTWLGHFGWLQWLNKVTGR